MLSSWTLRELLRRTKSHHADADLVQLQLLGRVDTLGSYRKHLTKLYGFQRPLQSFFTTSPELSSSGLVHPMRLMTLRDDLLALGVPAHELTTMRSCTVGMTADDFARTLGWFFVAERISLLSTLILRKLKRRLSPELFESTTTYMASCSSQSGTRWIQLGTLLDRRAAQSDLLDRVEVGAHEAFDCQRAWFGSFRTLAAAQAC
jgi:heme oxygenase